MTPELRTPITPRLAEALNEIEGLIAERFPRASFAVEHGDDPSGVYLIATVDIEDTDEVIDLVGDRLVDLQVDEGLPIYVAPLRPIHRVLAELRARASPELLAPLPT